MALSNTPATHKMSSTQHTQTEIQLGFWFLSKIKYIHYCGLQLVVIFFSNLQSLPVHNLDDVSLAKASISDHWQNHLLPFQHDWLDAHATSQWRPQTAKLSSMKSLGCKRERMEEREKEAKNRWRCQQMQLKLLSNIRCTMMCHIMSQWTFKRNIWGVFTHNDVV
jgi:hypothetical protein